MAKIFLLGDEAVALGAIEAGLSNAYGYPGTPSTEIMEYVRRYALEHAGIVAKWCSNEKTAYENALGVSYSGKRTLVTMKHVGLNVAFDAFISSTLQKINGGLVVAVADDPGMHSSQNEQDTRRLVDFAGTICFEPRNNQEAYEMTKEAFTVSERFHVPAVIRLVTRLSHSRTIVNSRGKAPQNRRNRPRSKGEWICIPTFARKNYARLLQCQTALLDYSERSNYHTLELNRHFTDYGIITTGIGCNYYKEVAPELPDTPSHLHIALYPPPQKLFRRFLSHIKSVTLIEEGYPFIEGKVRSLLGDPLPVHGKMDGTIPLQGELNPDIIRTALGLPRHRGAAAATGLPVRRSQLCPGCPHHDTFKPLQAAVKGRKDAIIASDIGCYTLGSLPPYEIIDTALCMGASIGMAKGASEAGYKQVTAAIGDSTLLHSGLPAMVDAITSNARMVLLVMDNGTTAMTGGQDTALSSNGIVSLIKGMGADEAHVAIINPVPKNHTQNTAIIKKELDYNGFSVILAQRECVHKRRKTRR